MKPLALIMVAALSTLVALGASPPQSPEDLLAAAKAAIHRNDGPRAAQLLEKAVALRPNSAEMHYWLGGAYMTSGETAGVLKQVSMARKMLAASQRAVELDPNHIHARFNLVQFYAMAPGFMGGGEAKAREQATEIKRRDSFEGHRAFALIYVVQKKFDLARSELVEAVREEPGSARAHTALGRHLATYDKNYAGAFDEIEKAIQLDPTYMPAWFRLGEAAALGATNLARAEEALEKYLSYQPKDKEPELCRAHYHLGQIYEKAGKKAEARRSYVEAVRLRPGTKMFEEALKRVS